MSSTQSTPEIGADSPNSPSGDRFHLDQVTPEPSSKSLKRKKKVEDLKFEQKWGRKLNEMTEHEFGEVSSLTYPSRSSSSFVLLETSFLRWSLETQMHATRLVYLGLLVL